MPSAISGCEIMRDHLIGHFIVEPTFLDQRHEQRTGPRGHARVHVERAQGMFVGAAA